MQMFTQWLLGNSDDNEGIPNDVYRVIELIPKEAPMYYPIVVDKERIKFFKETRVHKPLYPIQIEDDIIFVVPNKKVISKDICSAASSIENSISSVTSIVLPSINGADDLFYSRLIPLYLQHRFEEQFVVDIDNRRIIWKSTDTFSEEEVISYLQQIIICKLKGRIALQLSETEETTNIVQNGFIEESDIKNKHYFSIKIEPKLTFVLRKYNEFIERDLKKWCISVEKPLMMKGIFQQGDSSISCYTINSFTKDMFLKQLDVYQQQVTEKTVYQTIPSQFVIELCKSFNIVFANEPISIRFVKSHDGLPSSVEMMYVKLTDGDVCFKYIKEMVKNYSNYSLDALHLSEQQKDYYSRKGVIFDLKRQLIHCFNKEISSELNRLLQSN